MLIQTLVRERVSACIGEEPINLCVAGPTLAGPLAAANSCYRGPLTPCSALLCSAADEIAKSSASPGPHSRYNGLRAPAGICTANKPGSGGDYSYELLLYYQTGLILNPTRRSLRRLSLLI